MSRGLGRPNPRAQLYALAQRNATRQTPIPRTSHPFTAVTPASKAGTKQSTESNK